MSIEIITSYPSKTNTKRVNYSNTAMRGASRGSYPITWIGIHGTGGTQKDDTADLDYFFTKDYGKGKTTFHYYIGYTGKIYEVLPNNRWGYVAGWNGVTHSTSIPEENGAIHIECACTEFNAGVYPPALIDSLFQLILYLMKTYNTIVGISGHGAGQADKNKRYKSCPGPEFPWSSLYTFLDNRKYTYKTRDVPYNVFQAGGEETRKNRNGLAKGEIIYDIVCTDPNAPVSESDAKTEAEVVSTNTVNYDHANDGKENVNADIFKNDPFVYDPSTAKYILVSGGDISATPTGGWIPSTNPVYTKTQSTKIKISNNPIWENTISWTITGCTLGGNTGGGASATPITATATKVKGDTYPVLRVGDKGICNGNISGTPCVCNYEVTDAGQTKVKAK